MPRKKHTQLHSTHTRLNYSGRFKNLPLFSIQVQLSDRLMVNRLTVQYLYVYTAQQEMVKRRDEER